MLLLPAFLESYRSLKDRTLKLVYETSELSPEQIKDLHSSLSKTGFLAFNTEPFNDKDLNVISELEVDYDDPKKTPSKRLRAVLYISWSKSLRGIIHLKIFTGLKWKLLLSISKVNWTDEH